MVDSFSTDDVEVKDVHQDGQSPQLGALSVDDFQWSIWVLVAANLLPLFGVMFLGWSTFDVVFLYWMENVVIGIINVLKMITCRPSLDAIKEKYADRFAGIPEEQQAQLDKLTENGSLVSIGTKIFMVPFFSFHYGFFCFVHLIFITLMLGGGGMMGGDPFDRMSNISVTLGMALSVIALFVSHLVSYFTNFLGKGEYKRTAAPILMFQPYARIVVLHIAIVFSGFFTLMLGQPIWLLILLVIGKIMLDLTMHKREHKKLASPLNSIRTN